MRHNPKRETMTTDQPGPPRDAVVERFQPTSGRFAGVVGLVTAGIVLTLSIIPLDAGTPLGVGIVACFGAVVSWAALLRPALWVTADDLVLRNILSTAYVPLAAIDRVIVTQVLAVSAGDRRYVSPVIGYTLRQSLQGKARSGTAKAPTVVDTYQMFVEERIWQHAADARERQRIERGSPEQQALADRAHTTRAWLEIAGLVALALAFVVWWFVH